MASLLNRRCCRGLHTTSSISNARLVKSLKPRRSSNGKFEVAPRGRRADNPSKREEFVRDSVPHAGRVTSDELDQKRREAFLERRGRNSIPSRDRDFGASRSNTGELARRPGDRDFVGSRTRHGDKDFASRSGERNFAPGSAERDFTPRTREKDFFTETRNSRVSNRRFDAFTSASIHATSKQLYDNKPTTSSTSTSSPKFESDNENSQPLDLEPSTSTEFFRPTSLVSRFADPKGKGKASSLFSELEKDKQLPTKFISPPLLPAFVDSLKESLGPDARPTPIQSLSIKWLLENRASDTQYRQFLLAAETGSGKSIAYLLPVLQYLKEAELIGAMSAPPAQNPKKGPPRAHNPRALILAPTHELSRQLSGFAKSLLHHAKLRVICASQANTKSVRGKDARASQMAADLDAFDRGVQDAEGKKEQFPVDVMIGTPMKVLEMVRGRGWDRRSVNPGQEGEESDMEMEPVEEGEPEHRLRRGRDQLVGYGSWRSKPELGLANVEWVVIDEADVLLDPDFQESTRTLLADIAAARGRPVPDSPTNPFSSSTPFKTLPPSLGDSQPLNYPFNLLLTSATIPTSLNKYLESHHPSLIRLASPRLHHLPKKLSTEYVSWTGGNKFADVEKRLRKVWAEDAISGSVDRLSKVVVFCNKSAKVIEMSSYFEERGIKVLPMTSGSEHRARGSNRHLAGFLKTKEEGYQGAVSQKDQQALAIKDTIAAAASLKSTPHVLITTSLLSRGLDFSPDVKHVFIVDEPRNMVDFLHRAGRSGRAGRAGKVVVFGRGKGRGSDGAKEIRRKVGELSRH
ncbi:P-loop containing nucleoside triphosphate hydrolase protein [Panaeolus papilionaceus]|nr:P-loop containing nucleoside triphosphate hydrolase protein [Panaeolus papilionaceus]